MLVKRQLLKGMTVDIMKRAKKELVRQKHLPSVIYAFSNDLKGCKEISPDLSTAEGFEKAERYLSRYVKKKAVEVVFIIGEAWRPELTKTKKDGTKVVDLMHTRFSVLAASPAAIYGLSYNVAKDKKGKITFTNREETKNIRNSYLIHKLWGDEK